jgi:nicotinamidase-related amidase
MPIDLARLLPSGQVALLLSEVQRGVIGNMARLGLLADAARQVGVIDKCAVLAAAARQQGAPVVHCLANTAPGRFGANSNARLFRGAARSGADGRPPYDPAGDMPCPEVWREGDVVSKRDHGLNPMADSQLDHRLRNRGITTVIVAGVSLNVAILNLAMEAVNHSYQVIVARDAVAGFPVEYAEPVLKHTLSFIATLASTDELIAAWSASTAA